MTKETLHPSDLRIGNLLIHDGVVVPVLEIRRDSLLIPHILENGCNIGDIAKLIEQFRPIALTPEILGWQMKKTGMDFYGISYAVYSFSAIWIYFHGDGSVKVFTGSGVREHKHIQYLHQLQNLYYALTGRELEVKIP